MTKYAAALLIAAATLTAPQAQSLDPITAEDTLKVTTAQVLDLSEDGRFVAIGARRLYDNAETNHRRYGDPTYFAPAMVEVQVINTRTGAADKIGTGLMNVRQAAFTRDGARLAMLTAAETPAGLPITSLWVYDVDEKDAGRSAAKQEVPKWPPIPNCRGPGRLQVVRRVAGSGRRRRRPGRLQDSRFRPRRRPVVEAVPRLGRDEPRQSSSRARADRSCDRGHDRP